MEDRKDGPYKLYEWDCLIFTNTCWNILYGKPWCEDWLDAYVGSNLQDTTGYTSTLEAIGSKLNPVLLPLGGSLVAIKTDEGPLGYGLGICHDNHCWFVGPKGLIKLPNKYVTLSWIPYD